MGAGGGSGAGGGTTYHKLDVYDGSLHLDNTSITVCNSGDNVRVGCTVITESAANEIVRQMRELGFKIVLDNDDDL